ncbi:3-deoxy-D-manno-octulosonic acid transferase [Phenylobacterium sp.]|uniref:3-deoxy-D-manno-octulosonic acid transferase n=1 Tax=Phenylobacterium sp. TaxID=1871053 RepID=UPI0039837C7F
MTTPGRTLPLAIYGVATALLEPLASILLRRRAARGREDPARLGERLGRAGLARPAGPLVWLHGVSVGETQSLLPLIEALRARRPALTLLVTSGTVTAAELLARRLPGGVLHQYAPVDSPAAVRRFLDHWRPDAGLLVESELWPNLILAAQARGVSLALLSARMTEESARGWTRVPRSARRLLLAFDAVLPQDATTETRLLGLGAETGPRLNLKLAGAPPPVDAALVETLQAGVSGRRVVLAASTHPGEEALIAAALMSGAEAALLIVAPRHPERGAQVGQVLRDQGFAVARRSSGEPLTRTTTAYVADTLGELGSFIALADVVVMGGSFVAGVGGHNPLEPARLGAAIVTGPHAFNAADVYAELFAQAAAIEARDVHALARHIKGLLAYPEIARRTGQAARAYAARQGKALEAALAVIEPLLPA